MNYKRMTIEEMRERIEEQKYSYEKLEKLTGLSERVIRQTIEGDFYSANEEVLRTLEKFFVSEPVKVIREAQAAYLTQKQQGKFTVEDYYALPDERRVELIDGVFYDMAAPDLLHQMIGGKIYRIIADYIDRNKGNCISVAAPVDVQLDCDENTVVQPDILILCGSVK